MAGFSFLPAFSQAVLLSEVQSRNDKTVADEDGAFSDWLEIYNPGDTAVGLSGWSLTDSTLEPGKWIFPDVNLPANGYLLVFASGKDRRSSGADLHTNFKLDSDGEYLALLRADGSVADAFTPTFPPLAVDRSYGLGEGGLAILDRPTPGFANTGQGTREVSFSEVNQFFTGTLSVEIRSQVAGAVIRYTSDGTIPTVASPVASASLVISATTTLRAKAFFPDATSSEVQTARYVRMTSSMANFDSNLPLVMLETYGEAVEDLEQTTIFYQFVETDTGDATGRASGGDDPQASGIGGLNLRGALSATFPKQPFKLETWNEETLEDEDVSLLGMPAEADWVLYPPYADKTLMKNSLAYKWWGELGHVAMRTRFVELFINQDGGALSADDYEGVYVLVEKIKRDKDRVDVEALASTNNDSPEVDGGYIVSVDDPDEGTVGFKSIAGNPNCNWYNHVYPRPEDVTGPQANQIKGYINQFENTLLTSAWLHPTQGYKRFIDFSSYVDYGLFQELTQNTDGFHRSVYFHKPRFGKLTMGPVWDFDLSMGTDNRGLGDPEVYLSPTRTGTACWRMLYTRMESDPAYVRAYWDRWHDVREGPLSTAKMLADVDAMAVELAEAQARNFARWPGLLQEDIRNVNVYDTWQEYVDELKWWLSTRLAWLDGASLPPPDFSPDGGALAPGDFVTLSRPAGSVGGIWYTLDGRDPRSEDGSVDAGALAYTGPISLSESTRITARVREGTEWGALRSRLFHVSPLAMPGDLAVVEIHYHPRPASAAERALGHEDRDDFEYIELRNTAGHAVDITGVRFVAGIEFDFSGREIFLLQPGQRVVIAGDEAAFDTRFGFAPLGGYKGQLNNSGELLKLVGADGGTLLEFTYGDGGSWPNRPDGDGSSLVIINPNGDPGDSENWQSSVDVGGSPGGVGSPPLTTVVINEVMSWGTGSDWVEIRSFSSLPIDLGGWFLSNDRARRDLVEIPNGKILPANGYLSLELGLEFDADQGGEVTLTRGAGGQIKQFVDGRDFGPAESGRSFGLHEKSTGSTDFPALGVPTRDRGNATPRVGPVVLSEILYDPEENDAAFIEIQNVTGNPVELHAPGYPALPWVIRGAVQFDFPPGAVLPPGAVAVVASINPATFRNQAGVPADVQVFGPYLGALSAEGEVKLRACDVRGDAVVYPLVERVDYKSSSPWPVGPVGAVGQMSPETLVGFSMWRNSVVAYANDPANWSVSAGQGGTPGRTGDNALPIITMAASEQLHVGSTARIPLSGTDPDGPDAALAWRLLPPTPTGVVLGDDDLIFSPITPGNVDIRVAVADADGGVTERDVNVTVAARLTLDPIPYEANQVFRWPSLAGEEYRLEFCSDLGAGTWTTLATITGSGNPVSFSLGAANEGQGRVFRVVWVR